MDADGAVISLPYMRLSQSPIDVSASLPEFASYIERVLRTPSSSSSSSLADAVLCEISMLAIADQDWAPEFWSKQIEWWELQIGSLDCDKIARLLDLQTYSSGAEFFYVPLETAVLFCSAQELSEAVAGLVKVKNTQAAAARMLGLILKHRGTEVIAKQRSAFELRARAYDSLHKETKTEEKRVTYALIRSSSPHRPGVKQPHVPTLKILHQIAKIVETRWNAWKKSQRSKKYPARSSDSKFSSKRQREGDEAAVVFDHVIPVHAHAGKTRQADLRVAVPEGTYSSAGLYEFSQSFFPPCMRAFVQRMIDGRHLKYPERKLFTRFAYAMGFEVGECVTLFDETGADDADMDSKTQRQYHNHAKSLVSLFTQKGSPSCLAILKTETPTANSACPFANTLIGNDDSDDQQTLSHVIKEEISANGIKEKKPANRIANKQVGDLEDIVKKEHGRISKMIDQTPTDTPHRACYCQKNKQDDNETTTCDCRYFKKAQCACTETLAARSGWHSKYPISGPTWYLKHITGYKISDFANN